MFDFRLNIFLCFSWYTINYFETLSMKMSKQPSCVVFQCRYDSNNAMFDVVKKKLNQMFFFFVASSRSSTFCAVLCGQIDLLGISAKVCTITDYRKIS